MANDRRAANTEAETQATTRESGRQQVSEAERLEALRERLYARGAASATFVGRHNLADIRQETPQSAQRMQSDYQPPTPARPATMPTPVSSRAPTPTPSPALLPERDHIQDMSKSMTRRSYRSKIMLAGLVFFIGAFLVSLVLFFFGNNLISGNNISIEVSGPLAISGGEQIALQAVVSNQNAVPIESATLIVNYPPGSQSATEAGREVFTERIPLDKIAPGEVVRIPIAARIFGEENQEKLINVAIEYRVQGSNATYSREAEPYRFKISSSPVVLNVTAPPTVSTGQESTIVVVVQSNSPTDIADLVIKANYPPDGFEVVSTEPSAVAGKDTWEIKALKPGEKKEITITGRFEGNVDDKRQFTFSAGVPNERDRFNLASILGTTLSEIIIEPPLLGLDVRVDNDSKETVVVAPDKSLNITIDFENPLDTVMYDGKLSVVFSGNTFARYRVDTDGGTYDGARRTITWDTSNKGALKEIAPGDRVSFSFTLNVNSDVAIGSAPEFAFEALMIGRRLSGDVSTNVTTNAKRVVKIGSAARLNSSLVYTEGPFTNSGPTPPEVGETTTYTLYLSAQAGGNALRDGKVTAVVPAYVSWQEKVSSDDNITYDAPSRTITWYIGNLAANARDEAWVQLGFLPSTSQAGRTPTIVEAQRFSATDAFTGSAIRSDARALTTELNGDPDEDKRNGRVQD